MGDQERFFGKKGKELSPVANTETGGWGVVWKKKLSSSLKEFYRAWGLSRKRIYVN